MQERTEIDTDSTINKLVQLKTLEIINITNIGIDNICRLLTQPKHAEVIDSLYRYYKESAELRKVLGARKLKYFIHPMVLNDEIYSTQKIGLIFNDEFQDLHLRIPNYLKNVGIALHSTNSKLIFSDINNYIHSYVHESSLLNCIKVNCISPKFAALNMLEDRYLDKISKLEYIVNINKGNMAQKYLKFSLDIITTHTQYMNIYDESINTICNLSAIALQIAQNPSSTQEYNKYYSLYKQVITFLKEYQHQHNFK